MILTAAQQEGLEIAVARYKARKPWTCIAGYAGTGKAQPIDTIIPTPNGYRKLGDIKPNDYVYDRFGNPTKVLSVHPQGELDSYIVSFEDGRQTKCNDEHLFTYYTSRGNLATKSIKEMVSMGLKYSGRGAYKFKIPVFKGIEYTEKDYDIDPYVIGAMIGDGCCKERLLTISSENDEIPSEIGRLIGATPVKNHENNYNWSFIWNETHYTKSEIYNRVYQQNKPQTALFFKDFSSELLCLASEKRIPDIYKKGSREQRFHLIQGLFDTDGSINENDGNRFNVRYTSVNYDLIIDIQNLLYELGYKSSISEDSREDKYQVKCYNLQVNIPNEDKINFFRLSRKKKIATIAGQHRKRKDYSKMAITAVEKENIKREMVCIYVDNPEHLYLTNDYIVTHNTTLVKFIIAALNISSSDVAYVAYTGKAASVLANKGCPNATTAHKLLYYSKLMPNGKYLNQPRPVLDYPYKLIIVDEISMLPKDMWELLLKHRVHVICCGDPFQLPPITPDTDNGILYNPHIFLDEIMRQAAESEIIRLSMHIREGKPLTSFPLQREEVQIFKKSELTEGMYEWADQIICSTNKTRDKINKECRDILNFGQIPQIGDKVISLENHWDFLSDKKNALTNGTIGYITDLLSSRETILSQRGGFKTIEILYITMRTETDDIFYNIPVDYKYLVEKEQCLTSKEKYALLKNKRAISPPFLFDYGYAITGHKAQGSEWNNILVIEEDFPREKIDHAKWLYTAVSRSSSKLVVIKK